MMKVINIEKKLPKKSGDYLALSDGGIWNTLHYSAKNKAFNVFDSSDDTTYAIPVTHWAKLPRLPLKVRRKLRVEKYQDSFVCEGLLASTEDRWELSRLEEMGCKLEKHEKLFLEGKMPYEKYNYICHKRMERDDRKYRARVFLKKISDGFMFLLTGKGALADEMIEAGVIDYSGQGRDEHGR